MYGNYRCGVSGVGGGSVYFRIGFLELEEDLGVEGGFEGFFWSFVG